MSPVLRGWKYTWEMEADFCHVVVTQWSNTKIFNSIKYEKS